jgi:V/A-type H+-transporting ATPase subunit I
MSSTHVLNWIQEVDRAITLPFTESNRWGVHVHRDRVGVVQIVWPVLGVINAVRTKNRHPSSSAAGYSFVLALRVVVAFTVAAEFGSWAIWGQILSPSGLAGFVYAVRGGGIMGVIETLEAFTGMASYIRIMAVGLAGAIFAEAINKIVLDMARNPAMAVLAVLIGIVLHSLNFVISAFSPAIHAMRLNFLEFFRGFYETGGQQYSPFTKTGGEKGA